MFPAPPVSLGHVSELSRLWRQTSQTKLTQESYLTDVSLKVSFRFCFSARIYNFIIIRRKKGNKLTAAIEGPLSGDVTASGTEQRLLSAPCA